MDYVHIMFSFRDMLIPKIMQPPVYLWHYGTIYVYMYVDTYYGLLFLSLHCGIVLLASLQPYQIIFDKIMFNIFTDKL